VPAIANNESESRAMSTLLAFVDFHEFSECFRCISFSLSCMWACARLSRALPFKPIGNYVLCFPFSPFVLVPLFARSRARTYRTFRPFASGAFSAYRVIKFVQTPRLGEIRKIKFPRNGI